MKIKKRMAIMIHLSDIREMIALGNGSDAASRVEFVKMLVMDDRPMDAELDTDELDLAARTLEELRSVSARIFELKMRKNALVNERDRQAVNGFVQPDLDKTYIARFDEINPELNGLLRREHELKRALSSKKE